MTIAGVLILLFLGLALLYLEFFVIPGISIAAIGAIVFFTAGIVTAYIYIGSQAGNISLLASLFLIVFMFYISLNPRTWKRISLSAAITGGAKDNADVDSIKPGDRGVAKSRLAPIGEVLINGNEYEAQSMGEFINAGTEIEVVKSENSTIIIKPIKK